MKFIHVSDLHFPVKVPWYSLRGKEITGYFNFTFRRKNKHPQKGIEAMLAFIKSQEYDCLILSGDITNISHEVEFKKSREILNPILDDRAFLIPGNHDRYMKRAITPVDLFDKYFKEFSGEDAFPGGKDYIRYKKFKDITLIGWDSSAPTPIAIASGYVPTEVVEKTHQFVKSKSIKNYSIVCHHPIWSEPHFESVYHKLKNREEIAKGLKANPPLVYFHGHCHSNWVKYKSEELPFHVINSASSTKLSSGYKYCGLHAGEITQDSFTIDRYEFSLEEDRFVKGKLLEY